MTARIMIPVKDMTDDELLAELKYLIRLDAHVSNQLELAEELHARLVELRANDGNARC